MAKTAAWENAKAIAEASRTQAINEAITVVRQNLRDAKQAQQAGDMSLGAYDHLKDYTDKTIRELRALK